MKNDAHISVRDLRVRYGNHEIIHGVDFTVRQGEFVSIVGKSGFGKSTLLYALAGFIQRQGVVQIPAKLGMVFQDYAVFPWLTVRGNIGFGMQGTNSHRNEIIAKHLNMTELTGDANKYPFQLSGGQSQRVALARALAADPSVILMDEPFGALDMFTRERMQAWLLKVWEGDHKTVLFVTHNIEEALFLSDRVIVFGRGEILGEFQVSFGRPRNEEIKFTTSFMELKRKILERMEIC